LCYQVEKLIKENSEKLKEGDKAPLEAAIAKTREAAKAEDADAIQSAIGELEQASHALSKTLYETQQAAGAGAAGADGSAAPEGKAPGDDEVVDAEFEVKD
jgi:molecular chaperone DnaK